MTSQKAEQHKSGPHSWQPLQSPRASGLPCSDRGGVPAWAWACVGANAAKCHPGRLFPEPCAVIRGTGLEHPRKAACGSPSHPDYLDEGSLTPRPRHPVSNAPPQGPHLPTERVRGQARPGGGARPGSWPRREELLTASCRPATRPGHQAPGQPAWSDSLVLQRAVSAVAGPSSPSWGGFQPLRPEEHQGSLAGAALRALPAWPGPRLPNAPTEEPTVRPPRPVLPPVPGSRGGGKVPPGKAGSLSRVFPGNCTGRSQLPSHLSSQRPGWTGCRGAWGQGGCGCGSGRDLGWGCGSEPPAV